MYKRSGVGSIPPAIAQRAATKTATNDATANATFG
jgi:hypothetical protein